MLIQSEMKLVKSSGSIAGNGFPANQLFIYHMGK